MDELPQALKCFDWDDSEFPAAETPGQAQVKIEFFPLYDVEKGLQVFAPAPADVYRKALVAPPTETLSATTGQPGNSSTLF